MCTLIGWVPHWTQIILTVKANRKADDYYFDGIQEFKIFLLCNEIIMVGIGNSCRIL
jgi:hypothetical protein